MYSKVCKLFEHRKCQWTRHDFSHEILDIDKPFNSTIKTVINRKVQTFYLQYMHGYVKLG